MWRKNKQTQKPFIVQRIKRPFRSGPPQYGEVIGESGYNRMTGQMRIVTPTGEPTKYPIEEHELGHLLITRFVEDFLSDEEAKYIEEELGIEHRSRFYLFMNDYLRDNVEEAIAETFAARRFGWHNTDLGFNPAIGTPKIWAFVNMVAERYEH